MGRCTTTHEALNKISPMISDDRSWTQKTNAASTAATSRKPAISTSRAPIRSTSQPTGYGTTKLTTSAAVVVLPSTAFEKPSVSVTKSECSISVSASDTSTADPQMATLRVCG